MVVDGLPLVKPLLKGQPVSVMIRYRFHPGDFGMIPMPISPQLKYPLTVVGKCGEGYDMIFPGTHIKTETVQGLKRSCNWWNAAPSAVAQSPTSPSSFNERKPSRKPSPTWAVPL